MDKEEISMDKEEIATDISPGARVPERRSVRRRLIQSTLFPSKAQEVEALETNGDKKADKDCDGDEEDGVEECSGSQKRRKQKGKTTPQSKKPRKLKEKQTAYTTPKKNSKTNNALNGVDQMGNQNASPPIPNLRLEAKLTAEENSRMFAGRQIHPFFSSCKAGKRQQDAIGVEANLCSLPKMDKNITFGPIHVFERIQDDDEMLDWSNWTFGEKTNSNIHYDQECALSSLSKGSVKSLSLDKVFSVSQPSIASCLQNQASLDQCLVQNEQFLEPSPTLSLDQEYVVGGVNLFPGHAGLEVEQPNESLQERMKLYYCSCGNQPEDNLWTAKYQPRNAMEVCGNDESVKVLSEWLRIWQDKDFKISDSSSTGVECNIEDDNYNCYESNSDSENMNGRLSLNNVLLVTGPAGSGKSAAIYACAKEHGFTVLESNASEFRNGVAVRKLEEALHSHILERSRRNPVDSQSKQKNISFPAGPNGEAAQKFDDEVTELMSLSDDADMQNATKFVLKESECASFQVETKPLILFEDVDIIFHEDRGFLAAIQQIAGTGKGPIILTSSSNNPVLPDNMERLEVRFTMPSQKDLFYHAYMVCAAEKINIHPHSIEQLVGCCQGDLRKTIMHLQFWCQGTRYRKAREVQTICGPLSFDLEAGHQILPKIMPFGFPSQLSELVEKEIRKSLSMMKEDLTLRNVVEEEKLDEMEMQNGMEMHNNVTDSLEAKKEVMLSRNCSVQDFNDYGAPFNSPCNISETSGTPIAFSKRSVRRKIGIVLSSDSEDEVLTTRLPVGLVLDKDITNEVLLKVDSRSPFQFLASPNCLTPLTDKQHCSEAKKFEENSQYRESENGLHINYMCTSVDISCVPESFVPETEIDDGTELLTGTVSSSYVTDAAEEVFLSIGLAQHLSPIETNNLDKPLPGLPKNLVENIGDVIAESSHVKVESSQSEHMEAVAREYQVMDECSRMDFNRRSSLTEKPRSWVLPNFVQESWKKLRDSRSHLRQYVASEPRDAIHIVNLSYGMSNLISEVDLLLSNRRHLLSVALEPVVTYSEESDAFSWCDEQLMLTSTIAQHGFCSYAKDISALGSNMGFKCGVDLAWEMWSSSTNMAMDKLIRRDTKSNRTSPAGKNFYTSPAKRDTSLKSEMKEHLSDIVQSLVPSRSYLALKGYAFHEYLSSLGHISRSEASRLEAMNNKKRRRRSRDARNYLSTGGLMLSPVDISMVGQYNLYSKSWSNS